MTITYRQIITGLAITLGALLWLLMMQHLIPQGLHVEPDGFCAIAGIIGIVSIGCIMWVAAWGTVWGIMWVFDRINSLCNYNIQAPDLIGIALLGLLVWTGCLVAQNGGFVPVTNRLALMYVILGIPGIPVGLGGLFVLLDRLQKLWQKNPEIQLGKQDPIPRATARKIRLTKG